MDSYNVNKYNLYNIILTPLKKNFKIYHIKYDPSKIYEIISIKTLSMGIPFGIEKYNYKNILNIEFSKMNNDNAMYNLYSTISQIDKFFARLSYDKSIINKIRISKKVLQNISGKSYVPSVRTRPHKFDPLLRTYVKSNAIFHDTLNRYVEKKDIKSKSGIFILNLDSLWISKYNYGLIWFIIDGEIIVNKKCLNN